MSCKSVNKAREWISEHVHARSALEMMEEYVSVEDKKPKKIEQDGTQGCQVSIKKDC